MTIKNVFLEKDEGDNNFAHIFIRSESSKVKWWINVFRQLYTKPNINYAQNLKENCQKLKCRL